MVESITLQYTTADEGLRRCQNRISLGCSIMDRVLGGGILPWGITEVGAEREHGGSGEDMPSSIAE